MVNYDLNNDSIVFDLGGYEGQWASNIFSMYYCYVHIFEPVKKIASKAIDFIKEYKIGRIDLMKINIEGGEYDLLEHLLDSAFISNIYNIQVQFHDFVPNAESRMNKIQESLSKTHLLTY